MNIRIHADDFGFSEGINRNIIDSYTKGCLNSISIVPNGIAFESGIKAISNHKDIKLSIDTYKYEVAKYAVNHGFTMINDITAGTHDPKIFNLVAKNDLEIVLMHMQGKPKNMQSNPQYKNLIDEILFFFESRINVAIKRE